LKLKGNRRRFRQSVQYAPWFGLDITPRAKRRARDKGITEANPADCNAFLRVKRWQRGECTGLGAKGRERLR
jgi:hypothetical protein